MYLHPSHALSALAPPPPQAAVEVVYPLQLCDVLQYHGMHLEERGVLYIEIWSMECGEGKGKERGR